MNGTCFLCGTETKLTREHIIPQCLGGTLEDELYCKECNEGCGHEVDAELARQFGPNATLLQVARARGVNQPFEFITDNGKLKLRCDGKSITRADPVVRTEKDEKGRLKAAEVIARSEEEQRAIFNGLAKKYGINPVQGLFEMVENPPPAGYHEFELDNPLIHRAIGKIAYGFTCLRLPRKLVLSAAFDPIRKFILGNQADRLASSNYSHGDFMVDNQRPLHKIHLSLNRNARVLTGYVALFGTFRYTVLLSEELFSDLEWRGLDYTYNPVTEMTIEGNDNFAAPALTREEIVMPRNARDEVLRALQRGQEIIAEHSAALDSVLVEAVRKDET
jgi:hypothetical protein